MSATLIARGPSTVQMRFRAGLVGPANALTIGTVTAGSAAATITGSSPNQVLNLVLPKGDQGVAGPGNALAIGTVTTGVAGSAASATITGTSPNQTLNLTIPKGDTGASGAGSGSVNPTGGGYGANRLALFSDGTGTLIKDGGLVGNGATKNTGTTTGTLAAGDDSRILGAAQKAANLSDLASASSSRTNLGLGGAATLNVGTGTGTVAAGDDTRFMPPGAVQHFYRSSAPSGWLKADGSNVLRTTYAALWAAMGSPNTGDGSTTFTLPDLRGEFIRGFDDGRGVDGSRVLGSSQGQMIQNHVHPIGTIAVAGDGAAARNVVLNTFDNSVISGNPTNGAGIETRPRNIALLVCIKT